jgi:dTDP-4-amino-4,6-dideoxygalactose transaminase
MTTGEGGMVVTNDDALYEKLCLLRSHGMTSLTWDRHKGHAWSYDVVDLGYNYRIDEVRAALGKVQLAKLERNNCQRRHLMDRYREALRAIPQISVPFVAHPGVTAAHIMPMLLPQDVDRINFMEKMKSQRIQTSIHYPPIHTFSAYQEIAGQGKYSLPVTENVAAREVTLPLYPGMTEEEVSIVVQAISNSLLN